MAALGQCVNATVKNALCSAHVAGTGKAAGEQVGMRIRTALWLLAILLLLPGCHRSGNSTAVAANILRYPYGEEPSTFDPPKMNGAGITEMMQNVYEGLTTFDAQNRIVPCLAERWEISADGKIYTFHLRANAIFHNGRPMTAADAKFSFERALQPETASPTAANYLKGILGADDVIAGRRKDLTGVKVLDDHTLAITLDRPRGYFPGCLTFPCTWVVCKEALPPKGAPFGVKEAVGTGPFRITEFRSGSQVALEAFDRYWGGRPKLDRIERPIVIDPSTAHIQFETGQVDICNVSVIDYANDLKSEKLRSMLRLVPQARTDFLVMHPILQPAFAKEKVRRAFVMAIDREQIARLAFGKVCPVTYGLVPPGVPGANPNIRRIPYDPENARKLLAEAGYPGGNGFPRLTLEHVQKWPEQGAAALLIRDNLKQNLGIDVDVREHEIVSFYHDIADQEKIPFYISGWVADYADPQDFLSTLFRTGSSVNHYGYTNPAFDRLCDQADALSDMSKRIPLYQQAEQIAMDDVALMPLVSFNQAELVRPQVKNLEGNLMLLTLAHRRTEIVR